jgi:hypothetical protein
VARRRIYVGKGFEEGFNGGVQVLAVFEVKGTWLEIVPKRCSQTACGSSQSVCDQWFRMSSFQSACDTPLSCAIESEEGSNEKVLHFVE